MTRKSTDFTCHCADATKTEKVTASGKITCEVPCTTTDPNSNRASDSTACECKTTHEYTTKSPNTCKQKCSLNKDGNTFRDPTTGECRLPDCSATHSGGWIVKTNNCVCPKTGPTEHKVDVMGIAGDDGCLTPCST